MGRLAAFLRLFARRARTAAPAVVAFAALLAWMFGLYWSDIPIRQLAFDDDSLLQMRALWLAGEAIVLAALLAAAAAGRAPSLATMSLAGCALMGTGTIVILQGPAAGGAAALRVAGVVLTGLGSGLVLDAAGLHMSRGGAQQLLVDVSLSLLGASLLDACLLALPAPAQQIAVVLLPLLCLVPLAAGPAPPAAAMCASAPDAADPSAAPDGHRPAARLGLVRVVVLPVLVGLAYGLMQRLTSGAFADGAAGNLVTIASFLVSAIVIALVALAIDAHALAKAICFLCVPLVGVAYVMLPLFADAQEMAFGVSIVGFNSFYFAVWALWADRDVDERPQAVRFTCGLLALVASEAVGSAAGVVVVRALEGSQATVSLVSVVAVYVLLMAAIVSFDRSPGAADGKLPEDGGAAPPERPQSSDPAPPGEEPAAEGFDPDARIWAERYDLSPREAEVFALLARGRNRAYISQALFISDNTTRTHMKSIYRKLDVHSQQELIDLACRGCAPVDPPPRADGAPAPRDGERDA